MVGCLQSAASVKNEPPTLLARCLAADKNREVRTGYNASLFIMLKSSSVEIWTFLFDYYFIWLCPTKAQECKS